MHYKIYSLTQSRSPLSEYYHKFNALWRQYDSLVNLLDSICENSEKLKEHNQLLKLMQFLMGLDEIYAPIRSIILTTDPIPNVKGGGGGCLLPKVSEMSSHKGITSSHSALKTRNSAFIARPNTKNNNWNNNNNNNQSRRLNRPNLENKDHSTSNSFTDDQFKKLMALISDKSGTSSILANVAGFCTKGPQVGVTVVESNRLIFFKKQMNSLELFWDFLVEEVGKMRSDEPCDDERDLGAEISKGTNNKSLGEAASDIDESAILDENDSLSEGDDNYYNEFNDLFETPSMVPDRSQGSVNIRRSSRKSTMPKRFNDFKIDSKFMHAPLQSLLKLAFKVLRYLKNAPGKGISFNKGNDLNLKVYVDSDWAKCKVTRKSITGYAVFMGESLVSWKSKKQSMLSKSSAEAEYRAMNSVTCEVIWILKILAELNVDTECSAIQIAANPVFHERTTHFEIELFFFREKVASGVVKTVKVKSADNIADIFTKGLSVVDHSSLVGVVLDSWFRSRNLFVGFLIRNGIRVTVGPSDDVNGIPSVIPFFNSIRESWIVTIVEWEAHSGLSLRGVIGCTNPIPRRLQGSRFTSQDYLGNNILEVLLQGGGLDRFSYGYRKLFSFVTLFLEFRFELQRLKGFVRVSTLRFRLKEDNLVKFDIVMFGNMFYFDIGWYTNALKGSGVVLAVIDEYANESVTFIDAVACEVTKWMVVMKEDMDTRNNEIRTAKGLGDEAKEYILGMEIFRLLKGDTWLKGLYTKLGFELRLVAGIATSVLMKAVSGPWFKLLRIRER
ncbi:ribonuclease H-like domain-containing protein [Tanacetum coccineum]